MALQIAREIHFGDQACFINVSVLVGSTVNCSGLVTEKECRAGPDCVWDYSGLGWEYQVSLSTNPDTLYVVVHCAGAGWTGVHPGLLLLRRAASGHRGPSHQL